MHAVVIRVEFTHGASAAAEHLRSQVVPRITSMPGFVRGTWARDDDAGVGMTLWESREAADAAAEATSLGAAEAPLTVRSIDVLEVVAEA